jgi:hypothetical protein
VAEIEYIFETEHLRIRKFKIEDAIHLYNEMEQWIPNENYTNIEEARKAIKFYANCVDKKHVP